MEALPASGADAVGASMAQNALQEAETVAPANLTQFLGGKTFVQQGWVEGPVGSAPPLWVDTTYVKSMPLRWVLFGSDEYFTLAEDPELASWLAAGSEVILVLRDGSALRVTMQLPAEATALGAAPTPALPAPEPATPVEVGKGQTDGFWEWLWRLLFP